MIETLTGEHVGITPRSRVAKVETRDNIIGRTLRMGEVGPACLDYLRMTEKGENEGEWARQKAEEVKGA